MERPKEAFQGTKVQGLFAFTFKQSDMDHDLDN